MSLNWDGDILTLIPLKKKKKQTHIRDQCKQLKMRILAKVSAGIGETNQALQPRSSPLFPDSKAEPAGKLHNQKS